MRYLFLFKVGIKYDRYLGLNGKKLGKRGVALLWNYLEKKRKANLLTKPKNINVACNQKKLKSA